MRAVVFVASLSTACMPDIVAGAYRCGPDASCPDEFACSPQSGTCVLPAQVLPFSCEPNLASEPDNTAAEAFPLQTPRCVTAPTPLDSCMTEGDEADWLRFTTPTECAAVEVEVRLTFPLAFAELGVELWDLEANTQLATDDECTVGASSGDVRRCLDVELAPGKTYGIKIHRTGTGSCSGSCDYNKYELSIALATPS